MRIVLLYPPPWKIPEPGQRPYPPEEGAPEGIDSQAALAGDLIQAPYGLLSLAAQAIHAGHNVTVLNISNFPWPAVQLLIAHLDADIYGLSCVTANRRGVAMTADQIRRHHPSAHITVGGPHVSALPIEMLEHCRSIDTVVIGEGERTFLRIVQQLANGRPVQDLPGLAWRSAMGCRLRPPNNYIENLDELIPPTRYFRLRTLLTSRGCPMHCTYCCSSLMWGRQLRSHSVPYVLDMIETTIRDRNQPIIAIKDDTFTVNRQRVLSICKGIRNRGLQFMWSCESRADCLDEEVLGAMRSAGCKRISIGVESGSEKILQNIRKQITPAQTLLATQAAKKFGIQIRYYLMVGNRGETLQTFQQSLDLIETAKPNQFVFSQLHLYPGTDEYRLFEESGIVSNEIFFERTFLCLTCFAGRRSDAAEVTARVKQLGENQQYWRYGVSQYAAAITRLPAVADLRMDLCAAYLKEKRPGPAENQLQQAVDMGYFLPGLIHNQKACIAALRNDYPTAHTHLQKAAGFYPHRVVLENIDRLEPLMKGDRASVARPLELNADHSFETACVWIQPEFPDPLSIQHPFEGN